MFLKTLFILFLMTEEAKAPLSPKNMHRQPLHNPHKLRHIARQIFKQRQDLVGSVADEHPGRRAR